MQTSPIEDSSKLTNNIPVAFLIAIPCKELKNQLGTPLIQACKRTLNVHLKNLEVCVRFLKKQANKMDACMGGNAAPW